MAVQEKSELRRLWSLVATNLSLDVGSAADAPEVDAAGSASITPDASANRRLSAQKLLNDVNQGPSLLDQPLSTFFLNQNPTKILNQDP